MPASNTLDPLELKTVKYVTSHRTCQAFFSETLVSVLPLYDSLKEYVLVSWVVLWTEIFILKVWAAFLQTPWPSPLLALICRVDDSMIKMLEFIGKNSDLQLMKTVAGEAPWLGSALLERALKVTGRMAYFFMTSLGGLMVQTLRVYLRLLNLLFPVRILVSSLKSSKKARKDRNASRENRLESNSGALPNGEKSSEEDEYLSDTSDMSLLVENIGVVHSEQNGPAGSRVQRIATVEGKLKEVMHRRIDSRLALLRKNSTRITENIVNYSRQILEPQFHSLSSSIKAFVVEFLKEYEIAETVVAIYSEVAAASLLLKPYALQKAVIKAVAKMLGIVYRRRKVRRRRSMRSESMRRRARAAEANSTGVARDPVNPTTLPQSSEPVSCSTFVMPSSTAHPAICQNEGLNGTSPDSGLETNLTDESDNQVMKSNSLPTQRTPTEEILPHPPSKITQTPKIQVNSVSVPDNNDYDIARSPSRGTSDHRNCQKKKVTIK